MRFLLFSPLVCLALSLGEYSGGNDIRMAEYEVFSYYEIDRMKHNMKTHLLIPILLLLGQIVLLRGS